MSNENIPAAQPPAAQGLVLPDMSDEQVLAFTRGVRIVVVNDLMKGGAVSGENSDRIMLTNMLNGLDSQANASRRLQADKNAADASAATIAALLMAVDKNTIFSRSDPSITTVTEADITIPTSIPTPAMVPGEMDVVTPQLDYASFMANNGRDPDSLGSTAVEEKESDGIEY